MHLVRRETMERDYERLPYEPLTQDVLGVPIHKVVVQVVAGRNIAVLVEAAVRNHILQLRGIDTYQEFVDATAAMESKQSGACRWSRAATRQPARRGGQSAFRRIGVQASEWRGRHQPSLGDGVLALFDLGRRRTPPPVPGPGTRNGRGAGRR